MTLADLEAAAPGLAQKGHPEKIKIFGWYLHVHKNRPSFQGADIKSCYEERHYPTPASFSGYLQNLESQKVLIKNASGYRLAAKAREEMDTLYADKGHTVKITSLLAKLPEQVPDMEERTYLNEALTCYKAGAPRAAIVMSWNLAYHHLCAFILKKHLAAFNARWPIWNAGHYKKAGITAVTKMDDFGEEFKESQVITIARDANIITGDIWKILDEKLGKRNSAAHPSSVDIGQLQTDAFIDDLVKNVVLKLV